MRLLITALLCFALLGCGVQQIIAPVPNSNTNLKQNQTSKQSPDEAGELADDEIIKPPILKKITLVATGDILMHNTQIASGQQADGTFEFDTFFEPVRSLIQYGDYASTNFEAAMAGGNSGYTGYPKFNCPDEMAATLKDAGYDLVVTSNNHILDRGYSGALRTMKVLKNAGLDILGTYQSQEEKEISFIKDLDGVRVGYLAYSYGTNGIPVPKEHPYFFNFLNKDSILKDIAKLDPKVDVLVLILHWGIEYSLQPTPQQKELAQIFLETGADVILGSHPHVIQPMEVIRIGNQDKLVIYSMGNFIGDQRGVERNSGVIFNITFQKDVTQGQTVLKDVAYTPTYSHSYWDKGRRHFRVVAVEDAIRLVQEGQDYYLKSSDLAVLKQVLAQTQNQLGRPFNRERDSQSQLELLKEL